MIRAFSRRGRAACTLALAMSITAAGCSRSTPAAERTPIDAPALFAQACAKCHAADGTGGLPMVANGPRPVDLTAVEWKRSRTDAEFVAAIRSGWGANQRPECVSETGVERGRALLKIMICGECHTPRDDRGNPVAGKELAGGNEFKGSYGAVYAAANITSHPSSGIGAYSNDDLKRVFREGKNRAGREL